MAEIPFTAYAADCLVHARLNLPAGRLTDYLNERESLRLQSVVMQAHDDGRLVDAAELELDLGEVYAVDARGPRGAQQRRIRTRSSRMEIELGPYRVLGHVHAPTSGDPLAALVRRKPMVPITGATIAFALAGETRLRDVETLIVNRRLVDSVRASAEVVTKFGTLSLPTVDPRAKDFTGLIYS